MIAAGKGEISFLRWSDTGYINYIPGQAPCSGAISQHKLDSMKVACLWKRERTWSWLGREGWKSGKSWKKGMNMIKRSSMKFSMSKNYYERLLITKVFLCDISIYSWIMFGLYFIFSVNFLFPRQSCFSKSMVVMITMSHGCITPDTSCVTVNNWFITKLYSK